MPNRGSAANLFYQNEYRPRARLSRASLGPRRAGGAMCSAGAVLTDNRLRFAKGSGISWSVRTINRFERDN